MSRVASLAVISLFLWVSACANNRITPDDRKVLQAQEAEYQGCLAGQLRLLIDGSDDVGLIVRTAMGMCASHLGQIGDKALSLGYSRAYADGWVRGVRQATEATFTAFALERKAARKNGTDRPS